MIAGAGGDTLGDESPSQKAGPPLGDAAGASTPDHGRSWAVRSGGEPLQAAAACPDAGGDVDSDWDEDMESDTEEQTRDPADAGTRTDLPKIHVPSRLAGVAADPDFAEADWDSDTSVGGEEAGEAATALAQAS